MTLFSLTSPVNDALRRMVELKILAPEHAHTAETALHAAFGPHIVDALGKVPPPPSLPDSLADATAPATGDSRRTRRTSTCCP